MKNLKLHRTFYSPHSECVWKGKRCGVRIRTRFSLLCCAIKPWRVEPVKSALRRAKSRALLTEPPRHKTLRERSKEKNKEKKQNRLDSRRTSHGRGSLSPRLKNGAPLDCSGPL
jgi:hypothetical protein